MTTSESTFGDNNIPFENNPNPNNPKTSYYRPYRFKATEKDLKQDKIEGWNEPTKKDKRKMKKLPISDRKPNDTKK